MNSQDVKDYIDTLGSDPKRWDHNASDVKAAINADSELADYLAEANKLDDLLAGWEENEDGVTVGGDNDPAEQDDEADDEEETDSEDDNQDDDPVSSTGPVEFNPDGVQDLDGMFSQFIRDHIIEESTGDTFRVFTRDYDELVDIKVGSNVDVSLIDKAVAKATGALQKDMRRIIAARTQSKRIPGKRSGKLHGPNLHRVMSGDDRVFFRREEAPELDTAVSLVIDCSGSMRGERMKLATETAYAVGSVLNKLGVSFESLGFTDNMGDPRTQTDEYKRELEEAHNMLPVTRAYALSMPKFKTFDERWNGEVQRRFASVYQTGNGFDYGYTPEGCGVEFAARRLLQRPEKRKLMLVMTDGEPSGDIYYGKNGSHQQYGMYERQSVDVMKSVTAAGIDLVGIGIQHAGVSTAYSDNIVIRNLSEMPGQLLVILKKFMVKS